MEKWIEGDTWEDKLLGGAKAGTLHSSVCPHRGAVNHSRLPGFCMHSVYTQPLNIFICGCIHASPLGEGGGLALVLLHVWPCSESGYPMGWGLWLMETLSWKPPPLLFDCSWIPCWNSWELSHTQAPHSVWPWGSWDQAVLPRILPHFSTWVLFKQGCPSPD